MSRDTLAERIVEFIFMDNRNIDLFCGGCPVWKSVRRTSSQ